MSNTLAISLVATFLVCIAGRSLATDDEVVELTLRNQVPMIYVFGDSMVDVGNNDFLPPPAPQANPPYGIDSPHGVSGRFTNGYNLADVVAQRLGFKKSPPAYLSLRRFDVAYFELLTCRIGANYASGGSGILSTTGNGTLTLQKQIMLFNKTKVEMWCGSKLDYLISNSLFLISAGGNDFSAFIERGMAKEDVPAYIASMVSTYINHINALYKMGARRMGIVGVPAIGCTPGSRVPMLNGGCYDAANSMAQIFNKNLSDAMKRAVATSMPDMKYSIASTYNFLTDLMANSLVAGLRVVERACCGSGNLNAEVMCARPNTSYCEDRGDYMFWDKVHPTQATYERGAVTIFYDGSGKYAEPINFQELITDTKGTTMTQGFVYAI